MNLKNVHSWIPYNLAGKLQFNGKQFMEIIMNLKKYSNQIDDKNVLKNNCTFIEIKHYEKDKLLKTETYPLTHFLEGFENEFKIVRYN